MKRAEQVIRDAKVVTLYTKKGLSLEEIHKRVDITAEGVRQVLLRHGVAMRPRGTHYKNGKGKPVVSKREVRRHWGKRFLERYGVDRLTFYLLARAFPLLHVRYASHKASAQRRHIPWTLTLPQYAWIMQLHTKTPMIDKIGNKAGDFVLVRRNPYGAFNMANTTIIPVEQMRKRAH